VRNNELRATNKKQKQQLADKENAKENPDAAGGKKGRKAKSGSETSNVVSVSNVSFTESDKEELAMIASKFTYMSWFWLPTSLFKLRKDEDYDPATRFSDASTACQGQLQDLLEVIPPEWHGLINKRAFFSLVCI
jgi:hypothetical protein